MDKGALKPAAFNLKSFIEQEKTDEERLTDEEKILAQGADKSFWRTLKTHFERSIQELEQINDSAIASGMPFDEIGRNALVISQVKGVLRKIINAVNDAKEASDNGGAK